MNLIKLFVLSCTLFIASTISAGTEFTISTYNCGGLSDHYDYLRAASMQKVMQARYTAESEQMALNDKIQKIALKILFSKDEDKAAAQQEWDKNGYEGAIAHLTASPNQENSLNALWNKKIDETITSYQIRPVVIFDTEVNQMLDDHLNDLVRDAESDRNANLEKARAIMAKRIFAHHLKYDIICLQEADYLNADMFPQGYEVAFSNTDHSKNGIAWNTERFSLVEDLGNIAGRGYAVMLKDQETDKIIVIASGHLTGCNPYRVEINPNTGISDAQKGDNELRAIVERLSGHKADLMVVGMDSNVTSLHPRLNILKDASYQIDYENYMEPTCCNPHLGLDTRIDWIAIKPGNSNSVSIVNIPVQGVGLNNLQTNISDHKPIAAKISLDSEIHALELLREMMGS